MKTRLAVIWAAIIAAGVTAFGVLTGRRRRRRAERQKAREERRARRSQRKAQGGRKPAPSTARKASATPSASSNASGAKAAGEDGAATAAADAAGDDLQAIKGLGAVTAGKLRDAGVTTYAQIAAWSPEEAQELAGRLGLPPGRIAGEDWVGQARRLAKAGGGS